MDHARRRKYALVACFLHAISAFLIFVSEIYHFLVLPILAQSVTQFVIHHKLASYLVGLIPFVTAVLQLFMLAVHVYSIIAFAEQREAYSRWTSQHLKRMIRFSTKPTDRHEMNWLQGFFECCGVFGYEDWLPLTANNNLLESQLITDGNQWSHCTRNGCYLPHSCCVRSQLKCSPLILLQNYTKNEEIGKHTAKEWFYFTGCFSEVKRRLSIVLLVAFSVFNFIIQCITLLYSQIASTSYAMIGDCGAEDATAVLPAWILPFPPPFPQTIVKKYQKLVKQGRNFHDFQELVT
uniref:Bm9452 n=1 Tax=Brugia malayi TaxID=6279 RepID=A0A0K0JZC7_BRUMA|nr:Bm9452 [Brugia malayi]